MAQINAIIVPPLAALGKRKKRWFRFFCFFRLGRQEEDFLFRFAEDGTFHGQGAHP